MPHVFRRLAVTLAQHFRTAFDLESSGRLILYSIVVGVVAGLGAALFHTGVTYVQEIALGRVEGYEPPLAGTEQHRETYQLPIRPWAVLIVPALGGLLCGWLIYTYAPEAEGHGTDAMIRSFHRLQGAVRNRVPPLKTLASILTIGTGGSAGREGPIAQIGGGFGSFLATKARLSVRERRYLMLAGAAAGIGAIFRAPLGGALFACEVLYCTSAMEFAAFVPAVFASIVAYAVFAGIFGPGFAFTTPEGLALNGWSELPFYLVFALLCTLVGYFYVRFFYGLRDRFFRPLPIPPHFKPAVGGLLLGVLALWLPHVMAGGYGWVQEAIDGELTVRLMAILVVGKIVATSLTISSGGSGGVFAPSLFIGAMLGGAYGQFCHELFPQYVPQPASFVLVGMGGFFAGIAKVPLTALIMVSEMSGSYGLLVPLMLVSVVTVTFLSSRVTLYEEQVPSLIDSPAHQGDFVIDVLEGLRVRDVYDPARKPERIPESLPLREVLRNVANSPSLYFPVIDSQGHMTGIFSLRDLRIALQEVNSEHLIVAADLASSPVLTVTPDDDLHTALRRFTEKNIDELPIVDPEAPQQVVGMLRRRDLIAAYGQQLATLRGDQNQ